MPWTTSIGELATGVQGATVIERHQVAWLKPGPQLQVFAICHLEQATIRGIGLFNLFKRKVERGS